MSCLESALSVAWTCSFFLVYRPTTYRDAGRRGARCLQREERVSLGGPIACGAGVGECLLGLLLLVLSLCRGAVCTEFCLAITLEVVSTMV